MDRLCFQCDTKVKKVCVSVFSISFLELHAHNASYVHLSLSLFRAIVHILVFIAAKLRKIHSDGRCDGIFPG